MACICTDDFCNGLDGPTSTAVKKPSRRKTTTPRPKRPQSGGGGGKGGRVFCDATQWQKFPQVFPCFQCCVTSAGPSSPATAPRTATRSTTKTPPSRGAARPARRACGTRGKSPRSVGNPESCLRKPNLFTKLRTRRASFESASPPPSCSGRSTTRYCPRTGASRKTSPRRRDRASWPACAQPNFAMPTR